MTQPVRLLLDASAIVEYTRGSISVGEVIVEVDEEHALVGLPVACLAEACWAVVDNDRLDVLVGYRATVFLSDAPDSWRALAATRRIVGRPDAASVALLSIDLDVDVLSGEPGLYAGLAGGGSVIEI
jgi:hypothetical protein